MADLAVRAVDLGKLYRIGQVHTTLRGSLQRALRGAYMRLRERGSAETIWALRHVSFDLERGTVLGIVGRNGAGKTTLLKILTRITVPTEGYADVWGRVASLLEVGTGFHAELSGRDNIYLNGAILGMSRAEIRRKFDTIVSFAGVERFLDTPVKRYSSGMYMRLAFSVASHLEPDVLLVDEVLAVGDAEFQKRSIDKMHEVTSEGRTVVFVSHNMAAVKALCSRVLMLRAGMVADDGDPDGVVAHYLSLAEKALPTGEIPETLERIGTGEARLIGVDVRSLDDTSLGQVFLGQPFAVEMTFRVERAIHDVVLEVGLSTRDGTRFATAYSTDGGGELVALDPGVYRARLDLELVLLPGRHTVDLAIHHGSGLGYVIDSVERVRDFEVLPVAEEGDERHRAGSVHGFVRPPGRWHEPVAVDARVVRLA